MKIKINACDLRLEGCLFMVSSTFVCVDDGEKLDKHEES